MWIAGGRDSRLKQQKAKRTGQSTVGFVWETQKRPGCWGCGEREEGGAEAEEVGGARSHRTETGSS